MNNKNLEKDLFKEILDYIKTTDLDYVQIEKDGKKILLKRSFSGVSKNIISGPVSTEQGNMELQAEESKKQVIRSPIVGRFYSSSAGQDKPPLIVEGEKIISGQRVAIIEAMKIKKEVFSAYTGKVSRIHVKDGDPVEYGQELFTVEIELEETE